MYISRWERPPVEEMERGIDGKFSVLCSHQGHTDRAVLRTFCYFFKQLVILPRTKANLADGTLVASHPFVDRPTLRKLVPGRLNVRRMDSGARPR
jgi:hypothetical protein